VADVPEYITDPIEVDETSIEDDSYATLQARWPDWIPNDSNLETWMIPVGSRMTAYIAEIASQAPPAIMRYLGQLVGVTPTDAFTATVPSTWTVIDNPADRVIAAGTLVSLEDADGNPIAFEVDHDVTILAPALTTAAGEVLLRAVEEGSASNGLGAAGVVVDLLDPIVWVDTATLTAASSGGADQETDADYLNRLSARLTLLTPRPILPRDHALLARDLAQQNGVEVRALALDGYNPADSTFDNERMVAIAMVEVGTGADVDAGVKTAVDDGLQAMREVNFVVNVIDPVRNVIDVIFTITPSPGADTAAAVADAIANVESYLSPANSGIPVGSTVGWDDVDTLRRQEISYVINNTEGVDHWDVLTIGLRKAATAAAGTDVVTSNGHGYVADDPVKFHDLTGGAPLVEGTTYYARDITANTFKLAAAPGGVAIDLTSDMTAPTAVVHMSTAESFALIGPAALTDVGTVDGSLT